MGRKDLLEDSRFATLLERNKPENRIALGEIINDWTKNYNADELVDKILGVGVPAAPIFDLHDVTTDEHLVKAREMLVDLPHPVIGPMQVNGNPVKLMGTPVEITRHAPVVPGATTQKFTGAFSACPASGFGSFPKKASFKTSDQFFRSVLTFRRRLTNAF